MHATSLVWGRCMVLNLSLARVDKAEKKAGLIGRSSDDWPGITKLVGW